MYDDRNDLNLASDEALGISDAVIIEDEISTDNDLEIGIPIETEEPEEELTEEQKKELYVQQLKNSKIRFQSTETKGNITINKFGYDYKKKRQHKNKAQKNSRKINRK